MWPWRVPNTGGKMCPMYRKPCISNELYDCFNNDLQITIQPTPTQVQSILTFASLLPSAEHPLKGKPLRYVYCHDLADRIVIWIIKPFKATITNCINALAAIFHPHFRRAITTSSQIVHLQKFSRDNLTREEDTKSKPR